MKTLKLNTNSWHYHLATKYANFYDWGNPVDICTYTKYVAKALLLLTLGSAILTFFASIFIDFFMGIAFSLAYGTYLISNFGSIGWVFVGFAGLGGAFALIAVLTKRVGDAVSDAPDGFVSKAYASWKNKFCVQVEFRK